MCVIGNGERRRSSSSSSRYINRQRLLAGTSERNEWTATIDGGYNWALRNGGAANRKELTTAGSFERRPENANDNARGTEKKFVQTASRRRVSQWIACGWSGVPRKLWVRGGVWTSPSNLRGNDAFSWALCTEACAEKTMESLRHGRTFPSLWIHSSIGFSPLILVFVERAKLVRRRLVSFRVKIGELQLIKTGHCSSPKSRSSLFLSTDVKCHSLYTARANFRQRYLREILLILQFVSRDLTHVTRGSAADGRRFCVNGDLSKIQHRSD